MRLFGLNSLHLESKLLFVLFFYRPTNTNDDYLTCSEEYIFGKNSWLESRQVHPISSDQSYQEKWIIKWPLFINMPQ